MLLLSGADGFPRLVVIEERGVYSFGMTTNPYPTFSKENVNEEKGGER
jgi:hypothetical protein